MPTLSNPYATTQRFIPVVPADQRVKLVGVPILFASLAELQAGVLAERDTIDISPLWMHGQELRVATESPVRRVWTLGADAASSHARQIELPSGVALTLGADTSAVLPTTGTPAAGLGSNGDVAFDAATGTAYGKAAGAWGVVVQPAAGGGATNITVTAGAADLAVGSSTGAGATIPAATATLAGVMLPGEKTKLAGVANGATANATDAQLRDRATHTGTQPATSITGLAAVATSGAYSALSGLPTLGTAAAMASTAFAPASGIAKTALATAVQASLDKADTALQTAPVTTVAGRTGAVVLAKADVGLANVDNTSDAAKPVSTATQSALDGKQNTLVSGTSIKTINGESLLGSGNIVISGTAADTTAPTMLGSVSVSSITAAGAVLSWSAASDNTGVTAYAYSTNGGTTYTDVGLSLSVTLSGLSANTSYPVRVRARDAAGNWATPLQVSFTTAAEADNTAPTLVGSIEFTAVTQTGATITMPVATDNVAVANYRYSLDGGTTYTIIAGGARTVTVTGLAAGTTYQVRGIAADAAGNLSQVLSANLVTTSSATVGAALATYVNSLSLGQWGELTLPNKGNINGNQAVASISGDVMTVTVSQHLNLAKGQWVVERGAATPSILQDTRIVEQLTGTPNGVGTYRVSRSQTVGSRQVTIQGKVPRRKYFFDAGGTWVDDAAVDSYQGGTGGGVLSDVIDGFSAIRINPRTGQTLFRGGGHVNGHDGSIYGLDFRQGPGLSWDVRVFTPRYRPGAEMPPPWWNALTNPASLTITTGTGTAGGSVVTVASMNNIPTTPGQYCYVWSPDGGIQQGSYVTAVSGNALTLSKPLTESFSGRTVRYARAAYWVSENINGTQVPTAYQAYGCACFEPGTERLLLGGAFVAGGDYQGVIGAGWAYDATVSTNEGMLGPFQLARNTTARTPELARYGYALQAAYAGPGMTIPCDLDGNVYTFGRSYDDGENTGSLWRWTTPSSNPSVARVGNVGYNAAPPSSYLTLNAVCFPDPRIAGGNKRAIFHDQKRLHSGPMKFLVWSDITGTPSFYLCDWTQPGTGWEASGSAAPGYAYNSDKNVLAVTDGIDIWEFPVTFNGTTYVAGAFNRLTAGATGSVPTYKSNDQGSAFATIEYYPPAKCYIVAQSFVVRVIRAE